jgi:drug/metabolite transporter (DMT)-like permease
MAIVLALGTCLAWGISDYIAGTKARKLAVLTMGIGSNSAGLLLLIFLIIIRGEPLDPDRAFLPASAGGAMTALGILALYRALAIGPMTITAPIAATGAAVPVLVGALLGEAAAGAQWLGIAAALCGVIIASRPDEAVSVPDRSRGASGPTMALIAAGLLGGALVAVDRASESDALWTATLVHAAALLVVVSLVWVAGGSVRMSYPDLNTVLILGFLGAIGHAFFAWAASIGFVSVVGVVASLYPVITILLAQYLDREHVSRAQAAGVGLALAGVALIGAG